MNPVLGWHKKLPRTLKTTFIKMAKRFLAKIAF